MFHFAKQPLLKVLLYIMTMVPTFTSSLFPGGQGWLQEFSNKGADSSDEEAKIGLLRTIITKNIQTYSFHLLAGGLACSAGGYSPL